MGKGDEFQCGAGSSCCGDICVGEGGACCQGSNHNFVCGSGSKCCGNTCQAPGSKCCHTKGELRSDEGHTVRWLELWICRVREPLRRGVPVRSTQLMLWQHLRWGRQCLLPESGRHRFRVRSRFAVRQERVLGQGVRCWNSTTSSAPNAEMADDFELSCGMSTWWQLVASHMHLHRLP